MRVSSVFFVRAIFLHTESGDSRSEFFLEAAVFPNRAVSNTVLEIFLVFVDFIVILV